MFLEVTQCLGFACSIVLTVQKVLLSNLARRMTILIKIFCVFPIFFAVEQHRYLNMKKQIK